MAKWTPDVVHEYQIFVKAFVTSYAEKIDCADLALASLVEFAYPRQLPIKLKYYKGGHWEKYDASDYPSMKDFESVVRQNMGALNVIDNTVPIKVGDAAPGDLIMTKWSAVEGHTRVIYSIAPVDPASPATDYDVVWYQGNVPIVIPERREQLFSEIDHVFGASPRRWNYHQFEA
ncbi:MAG TPA: hypothetical protein VHB21_17855 [Minicystis sp.]|nr:hypothetical protein [Minicystis sp.]